MLVDHDRHPLTLDAIHRIVPGLDLATVRARTPAGWQVLPGRVEGVPDRIAITDGTDWVTLRSTEGQVTPTVSLLHEELIPAWGVNPETIAFHHALSDALALADPNQAAVELLPPRLDQVLSTAARGARVYPSRKPDAQARSSHGPLAMHLDSGATHQLRTQDTIGDSRADLRSDRRWRSSPENR